MLIYRRTSILESTAQTLVNTVNCVGVMGKGIALHFKEREPKMFAAYARLCEQKKLAPGKLWLWQGTTSWILNFPTKIHWRNPSRLEWIEAGLKKFTSVYSSVGIREISFPRLGCGNGGLDWDDVRPLMERYLAELPISVYIHDYTVDMGLPEHLDDVARELKRSASSDPGFDQFLETMRQAIRLSGSQFIDLTTKSPFSARMESDGCLIIEHMGNRLVLDDEDLRGIWIALLQGLLTREKAGWSNREGGNLLLSMLSILPQFRPIEIQRSHSLSPELAVERKPQERAIRDTPKPKDQYELACR